MPDKERLLAMIRLAMLEDEYGADISESLPSKRAFVKSHMRSYFFWESLLYLFACIVIFVLIYLVNSFNIPEREGITLMVLFAGVYVGITYLGLFLVRRNSLKKYRKLKRRIGRYLDGLDALMEIYGNEEKEA